MKKTLIATFVATVGAVSFADSAAVLAELDLVKTDVLAVINGALPAVMGIASAVVIYRIGPKIIKRLSGAA